MNQVEAPRPFGIVLPIMATIAAMAAFQVGAALAKSLFPAVGPQGAATLRLGLGAIMLMAIARPWRTWPSRAPVLPVLGLGFSMAGVILTFFLALNRLPLGGSHCLAVSRALGHRAVRFEATR